MLSFATLAGVVRPRLLLTSGGLETVQLREQFQRLLAAARAERPQATGPPRVCCVVTAQMAPSGGASTRSPGELRRRRWADAKKKSKLLAAELGAEFESVDAASPNFPPAKLEAAVASCDCVWVTGGNTFYLWHHMRASGLDQMVKHRLTQPGAFYFGQSAGSIVAGRSVSTAFWKGWDDPSAAPDTDWDNPENLAGMALADRSFFPHYDPQWADLVERRREELGHPVVALEDAGPAYVVGDDDANGNYKE